MNETKFTDLIDQYITGNISLTGKEELTEMLEQPAYREKLEALMEKAFQDDVFEGDPNESLRSLALEYLHKKINEEKKVVHIHRSRWWAVAASILLMVGIGSYFLFFDKTVKPAIAKTTSDVKAPETNRATITLASGQKVYLDSNGNGVLATQGNVHIQKSGDGQVEYKASPNLSQGGGPMQFNTLSNPRGSKVISLTLSDGTQVWLNAESSLTYPTSFIGNERKVEISGEAYFEVSHNAAMPFTVSKGGTSIQVLGTHFNVNAYNDEADIKVTLLEGSVKIASPNPSQGGALNTVIIKPSQQAQVSNGIKVADGVDLEAVMAWKNGLFSFKGADIKTIMNQVSRWYDVEIVFEKSGNEKFYAEVSRNTNVSSLFKMLEATKAVHFKIEGKKVTVMR